MPQLRVLPAINWRGWLVDRRILTPVVRLLLLAGALAVPGFGDDFCALTVHIVSSTYQPISSTWIELADPQGSVVLRRVVDGSVVTICDFGFGKHTLTIGTNECYPVAFPNLEVKPGKTIALEAILPACTHADGVSNGCPLYIRIVDESGKGVRDVAAKGQTLVYPSTDSYGRLFSGLLIGRSDQITFSKTGLSPSTVEIRCERGERIQRVIGLHLAAKQ